MKACTRLLPATVCALALLVPPTAAHQGEKQPEGAALHVQEHEEHGKYLVDRQGMALYLFGADAQGEAKSNCHEDCATAWPPLVSESEPKAHENLNSELLGTIRREGGDTQITYNGWPLYYFASDAEPGHTRGHDIHSHGAEWYLVTPEGGKAGEGH